MYIIDMPLPNESATQVRGFLGMAGFYRKFISDFAALTRRAVAHGKIRMGRPSAHARPSHRANPLYTARRQEEIVLAGPSRPAGTIQGETQGSNWNKLVPERRSAWGRAFGRQRARPVRAGGLTMPRTGTLTA